MKNDEKYILRDINQERFIAIEKVYSIFTFNKYTINKTQLSYKEVN